MGGTFNPVHNAHLIIAETTREEYKLDRVIFITGGNPPHKTGAINAQMRFVMTHMAIEGNDYFTDDDFEVNRTERSYSVHTLEYLKNKYPEDELFFIIGEDSLNDLEKWYEPERILTMCSILVFPRISRESLNEKIKEMNGKFNGEILPVSAPIMELSSSNVRDRIKNGKTVRYMVPDRVIEYIENNHLYEEW